MMGKIYISHRVATVYQPNRLHKSNITNTTYIKPVIDTAWDQVNTNQLEISLALIRLQVRTSDARCQGVTHD